jgi:hypothetical protein
MKCTRCQGLMVYDNIYNLDGQYLKLEIGRCLNCGHIVDLTGTVASGQNPVVGRSPKEQAVA